MFVCMAGHALFAYSAYTKHSLKKQIIINKQNKTRFRLSCEVRLTHTKKKMQALTSLQTL